MFLCNAASLTTHSLSVYNTDSGEQQQQQDERLHLLGLLDEGLEESGEVGEVADPLHLGDGDLAEQHLVDLHLADLTRGDFGRTLERRTRTALDGGGLGRIGGGDEGLDLRADLRQPHEGGGEVDLVESDLALDAHGLDLRRESLEDGVELGGGVDGGGGGLGGLVLHGVVFGLGLSSA